MKAYDHENNQHFEDFYTRVTLAKSFDLVLLLIGHTLGQILESDVV